ncbi:HlyC/CorC family transporter [Baekduia soli]|uniref:HlyC/CorC family transporter n=1 Tax=Baekduia soli TaxID=496014 RepID=A0A5B8UAG1_9ACTN|nr:hemolysin family protein [Baekduia soli]QEC50050.1 HlyC/CorC family transporter [Baekduia soli]
MTVLLLLAVAVLIAINGFFVAAEFGLVRSRRSSLQEMAEDGSAGARRALLLHDDLNQYLSACQFGITLASLGIGFLGEPAIATIFEPLFGGFSHGLAVAISVAIAYIVVTACHVTVGEQVPKIYSIIHPDRIAILVARPLTAFDKGMKPFISLLNAASNALLRLLRVDPQTASEEGATPEELRILISQARAGGKLDAGEAGMLSGVFHLHEQEARQVMTPIPAVVTVDLGEDVETALRRCISSGHTRLVVTEDDNRDRVRGIVHSNSLARALMAEGPQASLEPLVREAVIVPETKPLDDLLADLQRERSSMAVVVDEYGRVVGIVTVEDIIEEVVGEIDDETDPAGGQIRRLANGDWFVRGHVAVTDLLDHGLELPVDTDAYNSVGGFVFAELGRLPRRGDTVTADGYSIRVESVRENRIEAVRIRERRPPQSADPSGTAP